MSTGRILALAAVVTAGCGGSRRGGERSLFGSAPWDRAVKPPKQSASEAGFATGRVASVSADGLTLEVEIDQGVANVGDPVTVVMSTPRDPSPRNFTDEVRERRVATARVVEAKDTSCTARIVPDGRGEGPVPGDKVSIRSP